MRNGLASSNAVSAQSVYFDVSCFVVSIDKRGWLLGDSPRKVILCGGQSMAMRSCICLPVANLEPVAAWASSSGSFMALLSHCYLLYRDPELYAGVSPTGLK